MQEIMSLNAECAKKRREWIFLLAAAIVCSFSSVIFFGENLILLTCLLITAFALVFVAFLLLFGIVGPYRLKFCSIKTTQQLEDMQGEFAGDGFGLIMQENPGLRNKIQSGYRVTLGYAVRSRNEGPKYPIVLETESPVLV